MKHVITTLPVEAQGTGHKTQKIQVLLAGLTTKVKQYVLFCKSLFRCTRLRHFPVPEHADLPRCLRTGTLRGRVCATLRFPTGDLGVAATSSATTGVCARATVSGEDLGRCCCGHLTRRVHPPQTCREMATAWSPRRPVPRCPPHRGLRLTHARELPRPGGQRRPGADRRAASSSLATVLPPGSNPGARLPAVVPRPRPPVRDSSPVLVCHGLDPGRGSAT